METEKASSKYYCAICNIYCKRQHDLSRHNSTIKHKSMLLDMDHSPSESENTYNAICCTNCNAEFKTRSGLWKHSKKCKHTPTIVIDTTIPLSNTLELNDITSAELVMELLKQNQEFKSLLIDQSKKMMELATTAQTTTINNYGDSNHNNNTNNTNNTQFNLNFFLNETCKDAMNITDFLATINVTLEDLEHLRQVGYVDGVSGTIIDKLKSMAVNIRPLHCTDLKRETIYYKEENKWSKDKEDHPLMRVLINRISKKNYREAVQWRNNDPDCMNVEHEKFNVGVSMLQNSIGGSCAEEQKWLHSKIIHNVAKMIVVDKSEMR